MSRHRGLATYYDEDDYEDYDDDEEEDYGSEDYDDDYDDDYGDDHRVPVKSTPAASKKPAVSASTGSKKTPATTTNKKNTNNKSNKKQNQPQQQQQAPKAQQQQQTKTTTAKTNGMMTRFFSSIVCEHIFSLHGCFVPIVEWRRGLVVCHCEQNKKQASHIHAYTHTCDVSNTRKTKTCHTFVCCLCPQEKEKMSGQLPRERENNDC